MKPKAYEVNCDGTIAMTWAPNRGAAKMRCVRSAREAGYYTAKKGSIHYQRWPRKLTAKRRPDLDDHRLSTTRDCYTPEYVTPPPRAHEGKGI